jgi:hypothetical protein
MMSDITGGTTMDDDDPEIHKELERQFKSNGPSGLDEQQLMAEYLRIGNDPTYDFLTRRASMTRYHILRTKHKLREV